MSSDVISIVGTVITILGIIVTIYFAKQADKHRKAADKHEKQAQRYSNQIKSDLRKINLSNCTDMLKKMLEEVRRLPIDTDQTPKGVKVENLILNIKSYFDGTLSLIDTAGSDREIRRMVSDAQVILHRYERDFLAKVNPLPAPHDLQVSIQDCISNINSKIYSIEG
ncbi:phage holin family protein [Acinetobacter johnsonii]|uniref:DUF2489 domain-containing protein n=2 Tax=Acinetobacter johnsonii TaxID=40214 RepID=A0A3R9FS52_ACIJO|nr:hypothetical protein [Acinetobacter johnsonii]RSE23990.1 hypothetical protein EGT73_07565 [Acinetobacter johnsonii]